VPRWLAVPLGSSDRAGHQLHSDETKDEDAVSDEDTEFGLCGPCGHRWQVKNDGTLYKHSIQGVTCEGSGQRPASGAEEPGSAAAPAEEETDVAEDGEGWLAESGDDDAPAGTHPPATEQPLVPARATPLKDLGYDKAAFAWLLSVKQPALYLDDPAWHAANARMAGEKAQAEGHDVLAEAQCTSVTAGEEEGTVWLTYTVPVKSH
jgi:hypothetical protein